MKINKLVTILFMMFLISMTSIFVVQANPDYRMEFNEETTVFLSQDAEGTFVVKNSSNQILGLIKFVSNSGQYEVFNAQNALLGTADNINPQALELLLK